MRRAMAMIGLIGLGVGCNVDASGTVVVPNNVGLTLDAAMTANCEVGLTTELRTASTVGPQRNERPDAEGVASLTRVTGQEPAQGATLRPGDPVQLTVEVPGNVTLAVDTRELLCTTGR